MLVINCMQPVQIKKNSSIFYNLFSVRHRRRVEVGLGVGTEAGLGIEIVMV